MGEVSGEDIERLAARVAMLVSDDGEADNAGRAVGQLARRLGLSGGDLKAMLLAGAGPGFRPGSDPALLKLEREIDPEAKVPVDMILDHARETGELLQAVVSRGTSDGMRRINSDLGEVLDLIMLMQLEKGHAPADDALTLLLQLRRELETLRAV